MPVPPEEQTAESRADQSPRDRRASRTAAAGREFFYAVGGDLRAAARRLRARFGARRLHGHEQHSRSASSSDLRVLRRFGLTIVALTIAFTLLVSGAMLWALHDLPLDQPKGEVERPALLIEAAGGEPLGRVGPLKVADASREEFPDHLVQAVLSVEDRRFYSHFGFDPQGIVRAMRRNFEAGEIVEGGSTITQQLVKIRMLGNDRTYTRKLREALTAVWLELRLSKDEIITRYLNSVYMGAGAHGMAAAARLYFDKHPSDLTLAEAAMLAGLVRAPSLYNPLRDLETARARAGVVLDAMVATGAIDAEAAAEAEANPAELAFATDVSRAESWFAGWVAKEAADLTGSFTGTLRVRTTLVPELQGLAESIVETTLAEQGDRANVSEAALVALRPDGAVLAMVGGRDYGKSQFNRAAEANRHPGSAFKLFVYLAALRAGYSPEDTIDAGPIEIKGWQPENFADRKYGRMTLADAFAQSVNTAAVRLAMQVGLDKVIAAARDLGIDAELPPLPSMALGAVEVSLLDLTSAFASLQSGRLREPWGVAALGIDSDKRLRSVRPHLDSEQAIGPERQSMIDLLRLVVERGTGRAAALGEFAAGKTGTSQNHRDAWFIGFNESLIVGVWIGNDDGTPMERVVGGGLPATMWKRFMQEAAPPAGNSDVPVAEVRQPPIQQAPPAPQATATVQPAAASENTSRPLCDYRACASAYRSFQASDCTYQPFSGPRQICDIGAQSGRPSEQASRNPAKGRSDAICNIDVCSQFYSSFDESDCTYQPFGGGPRRICDR